MENPNFVYKRLVRSVVKKMLNRSDEDIEQEIYLRLWQKYPTYHEQDKLCAWIRTVAENYCKDYLRSKSCKIMAISQSEDEEKIENYAVSGNPEYAWLVKCRRKLILEAVDALPKDFKKAIILVEFKGASYEVAAAKLGINLGTLKSRLHRAKQILHEKLAYLEV